MMKYRAASAAPFFVDTWSWRRARMSDQVLVKQYDVSSESSKKTHIIISYADLETITSTMEFFTQTQTVAGNVRRLTKDLREILDREGQRE